MLEFLKGPFLVLHSWSYTLVNLCDDIVCNVSIFYAVDTILYSKCEQASDLWQQLELATELESDLLQTGAASGLLILMLKELCFVWSVY